MHPTTIDPEALGSVTGGADRPGPIARGIYGALVAGTIALGHPAGQSHSDPSAGPLHGPVAPVTTSQAR